MSKSLVRYLTGNAKQNTSFIIIAAMSLLALACTDETATEQTPSPVPQSNCHAAYPDACIRPPPPDLDCEDIPFKSFRVVGSDPHRFDRDEDGIGC